MKRYGLGLALLRGRSAHSSIRLAAVYAFAAFLSIAAFGQTTLNVTVSPAGSGQVNINGGAYASSQTDTGAVNRTDTVGAQAATGWVYDHFEVYLPNGTLYDSGTVPPPLTPWMNQSYNETIFFRSTNATLSLTVSPAGAGLVRVNGGSWASNVSVTTALNSTDTIEYQANSNYVFDRVRIVGQSTGNVYDPSGLTPYMVESFTGTVYFKSAGTAPSITGQPSGATITVGGSASLSVSASGTAPLAYQWYKNGTAIGGATGSSYAVAGAQISDAGTYSVVVSNPYGSVSSGGAVLNFSQGALSIGPSLRSIQVGGTQYFTVSGGSTGNYVWSCSSGTLSSYSGAAVQWTAGTSQGSATIAVYDSGSGTYAASAQYFAQMTTVAEIFVSLSSYSFAQGQPPTISCPDTMPLAYRLRAKVVNFTGTWSSIGLTNEHLADSFNNQNMVLDHVPTPGNYSVLLYWIRYDSTGTNIWQLGPLDNTRTITVLSSTPPAITQQPASQSIVYPGSASFSCAAVGSPAPAFQWYSGVPGGGMAISGATASSYSIGTPSVSMSGTTYYVVVSNSAGSVTSNIVTLTVAKGTQATAPAAIAPSSIAAGSTFGPSTFSAGSGTRAGTPTWYYRTSSAGAWQALSSSMTAGAPGSYLGVQVTYDGLPNFTPSTSLEQVVTISPVGPTIATQPASQTVSVGQQATFAVAASGSNLSYQWYKNGAAITGAVGSSLSIQPVTLADAGQYYVTVTNSVGSATSATATLMVKNGSNIIIKAADGLYYQINTNDWSMSAAP